jgi:hypothetical protein
MQICTNSGGVSHILPRICHHQKGGVCEKILYFELILNDSKLCDHHPNVGCALHYMIHLCFYCVFIPFYCCITVHKDLHWYIS